MKRWLRLVLFCMILFLAAPTQAIFAKPDSFSMRSCTGTSNKTNEPAPADLHLVTQNWTYKNRKSDEEQPRIVERRTTPLDIAELKELIGVYEEGKNYNQLIDGHGTGLRPPTDDEWAAIMNNSFMVENVLVDSTIQAASNVDLTTTLWFPPIGNQGSQGSCVAWAVGYYTKTFQEAREHNWSLSGAPSYKITSPSFIYNLINDGVDEGSYYDDAVQLVCSVGACSLAKMPYNAGDYTSWPSEQAWSEAMFYRGAESGIGYLNLQGDAGLANLKNWLSSENLAVLSVDASKIADPFWGTSRLDGNDMLTLDNYVDPIPNHAGTIVGYNDNFAYNEQGQTHYGAFKIANSWGIGLPLIGWEHIRDGCYWISYEAMKQRVGSCMIYSDRIGYEPELTATFEMSHAKRGECFITVGAGNASNPLVTKSFNQYISGGSWPFCPNRILFDITEFRNVIDIDSQQCFLRVIDYGSSTTGTILYFAINNAVSSDPPVATVNNQYVFANLILHLRLKVPEDFPTIQEAINAAYPRGYIISVAAGTYYENIELNKTVSLVGENVNTTILNGGGASAVVSVVANNSRVDGFTIAAGSTGIRIGVFSDPVKIACGNVVVGNLITNVTVGIHIEDGSSNNTIFTNIIEANNGGIYLSSSYNTLFGNSITGYDAYYGISLTPWESGTRNNDISRNMIRNCTSGIRLAGASQGVVRNNILEENDIADCDYGIYLYGSSYNDITGNTISAIREDGIVLDVEGLSHYGYWASANNTLADNRITSNHYGILIIGSWNNEVVGNIVEGNMSGLCLQGYDNFPAEYRYSHDNIIVKNNIAESTLYGIELKNASDNSICHNNFFNNGIQVYTEGAINKWDDGYPSGGNYWSDYAGTDSNRDGMGDTPYVIDANNQDNYPLVHPFGSIRNLNTTLSYLTIQDAIDAANEGDTIFVKNGTYPENVVLNKSISLLGEDRISTIIDGEGSGMPVITVTYDAEFCSIVSFTVKGGSTGIDLEFCRNTTISDNIITQNNDIGIYAFWPSNSSISNNYISSNGGGIYLQGTPYQPNPPKNSIMGNQIVDNGYGIYLLAAGNNVIDGNRIEANSLDGVVLDCVDWQEDGYYPSTNNTISGNVIDRNRYGLRVIATWDNKITRNNITDNEYGIGLDWWPRAFPEYPEYEHYCENNTIAENVIEANSQCGIQAFNSIHNFIFHNNFIGNGNQAVGNGTDIWDNGYPSGGNYWSDYTDVDEHSGPNQDQLGSDYVWDHPYVIDSINQDHYPLVNKWSVADVNHDGVVNVLDAAAISAHWYPGPPIGPLGYDPIFDINDDGNINVLDAAIVSAYWTGPPKGPLAP